VDRVVAEIESMLSLATHDGMPPPAIVQTVATDDRGIDELWAAVEAFRTRSAGSGLMAGRRRAQLRRQLEETLQQRLLARARTAVLTPEELEKTVDRLEARTVDPLAAADEVIERMGL
jgi:LAO/AO transport system kinase